MTSAATRRDLDWLKTCNLTVLTQAEAAEVLGVDPRTVSRAISNGELPAIRIGRRVLIPRLRLLALLDPSTTA